MFSVYNPTPIKQKFPSKKETLERHIRRNVTRANLHKGILPRVIVLRSEDTFTKPLPKTKGGRKSQRTKKKEYELISALLISKSNAKEDIGIPSVVSKYQYDPSQPQMATAIPYNPLTTKTIEYDPGHPQIANANVSYSEPVTGNLS